MFAVSTSNVSTQFGTQTKKISSSVRSRKSCHQQKKIVTITKAAFKTDNSQRIFKEAQDLLPGGVNSPVRAFKSVGGQPIVFDRVKGPYAWDVDGNRYIDYVGSWGPAICGHAHPEVIAALQETLEKGTSFEKSHVSLQMPKKTTR